MRAALAGLLLFLAGAAGGAGAFWWKSQESSHRLETLLRLRSEENDRLRAHVETESRARESEKTGAQRAGIEAQVAGIRQLAFKKPVVYEELDRHGIKGVLEQKLADTFSAAEFDSMGVALARLGLLPEGYPLRRKYLDLLGEQVAAFYDQHKHKLFMFQDAVLANSQNQIVLAHELTHALQDQHFDLLRFPLELKHDDDRAEAASALVEGDATMVMSEFMLKNLSLRALKENVASSFTQNMDQLHQAPRFLQEELVFPYLRGQAFCSALVEQGGYAAVSQAFADPPASTAQILHPEKYLSRPRETPLPVIWTDLIFDGEAAQADNDLGELGIRILLQEGGLEATASEQTAAGWRGDRYLSFEKHHALVWKTLWRGEEAAARFLSAHGPALQKRCHLESAPGASGALTADKPRAIRLHAAGPTAVLLIDAPTSAIAAALEQQFSH